jgi:hypothetical protein
MVPRVSIQGQPPAPRFASEEQAEEELSPLFESKKAPEPPPAPPKEVSPEPAPFTLQPQPVSIEEAPAPPAPPVRPAVHINFDEPFEEEYARLIPSKPTPERESRPSQENSIRTEGEPHLENLDIPAFLRRPN